MLDRFVDNLTRNRLCSKDDSILLAVSGGVDSMVLLDLFNRAGHDVKVAHCNFQLRGGSSDGDESLVKEICEQLKIPFYYKRFNTKNYAVEKGLSIQMAARGLRYGWFSEIMNETGCNLVATAHHLNDNIETIFLNLIRGTGISGLKGIPNPANNIIRPLLNFTKAEIIAFAKESKIQWREDVSNTTDDYDRNFLRHQVVPKLKELNPSLEKSFERTVQRISGAFVLANLGISHLRELHFSEANGQTKIKKIVLELTPNPAGLVWELIKDFGFNLDQCQEIVEASKGHSGKRFYAKEYQLIIDREAWIIDRIGGAQEPVIINNTDQKVSFGDHQMDLIRHQSNVITADHMTADIDVDKVTFPITWRKWKEGDSFYPLGMNNRKKLSDFFVDEKVSLADKNGATVLETEGEIIWVVGYRIDNRYKVTDQTKEIIQFKFHPYFT